MDKPIDTPAKEWDVFISHSSEDKVTFVAPLAKALSGLGVKVWYDKFTLKTGDVLTGTIDEGLSSSKFGVVVISPSFIKRKWTQYELRGLSERGKSIIPVWHNVTVEDVRNFNPAIAEKLPINLEHKTPLKIAYSIIEIIRPDILENVHRRIAYFENKGKGGKQKVKVEDIKPGGILHQELPGDLISRIRLIRASLLGAYTHSMEFWMDGFKRDAHPTKNISDWEHIAAAYREYVSMAPVMLTNEQHKSIFTYLILLGSPVSEKDKTKAMKKLPSLPAGAEETLLVLYADPIPPYDIDEQVAKDDQQTTEFYKYLDIDKEVLPHDLPDTTVKAISAEFEEDDSEATKPTEETENKDEVPENTEEWYEIAAKSENDWVRAVVIQKDHVARNRVLDKIKTLQNSITNTLGANHREYGKVLLTLALYYDIIRNDRRKCDAIFAKAKEILGNDSRDYATAKKQQSLWYFEKKDHLSAEKFTDEALQILQNKKGRELEAADMLIAKSVFRISTNDLDGAIKFCKEALVLQQKKRAFKQINDTKERISYLMVQKKMQSDTNKRK
jgi:TIR domain.